jgi:hypothetical protein
MRRIVRSWLASPLLALAAHAAMPDAGHAQRISAFSVSAGVLSYHLAESGETAAFALRAEMPYSSLLMLEPGIMVARAEGQWLILPQTVAQLRFPMGSGVEPYVGGGAGLALGLEEATGSDIDVLLTGATGVRIDYGGLLGFVFDARAHAVGFDVDAHMFELTLGLRIRR